MAQTANSPQPGLTNDTRGVGTIATVDKNQRKTGYRPDSVISATSNDIDPNSLIRIANDPRLA